MEWIGIYGISGIFGEIFLLLKFEKSERYLVSIKDFCLF